MPLTMTAEREMAIRESLRLNAAYRDNGQSVAWNFLRDFRAELDAERAAHQETQRDLEQARSSYRELEPCGHPKNFLIGDEYGHFICTVCRHQETQVKLDALQPVTEFERLLRNCASDLVSSTNQTIRQLAETQTIARELLDRATKYHDSQECAWCYDDGQCDLVDIIAKAKAVLGNK